jgi:hypothetical protein
MLGPDARISLADLSAASVRLSTADAVTIVRQLVLQVASGELPGVPSAHVIRIAPSGVVSIEGPVAAGGREVARSAQLLESLLPGIGTSSEERVPGALRLVIARALGTLDLPPYGSLESFAEALNRFAASDPAAAIREITRRWAAPREDEKGSAVAPTPARVSAESLELGRAEFARTGTDHEGVEGPRTASGPIDPSWITISDIRRARRATRLPLQEISTRSRIPVLLLRQLEWGYLRNWPEGLYGRTQLVRYARAAGLDERLVTAIVCPMLEEEFQRRAAERPVQATVVERAADINVVEPPVRAEEPVADEFAPEPTSARFEHARPPRWRLRLLGALATPALLAVGVWLGASSNDALFHALRTLSIPTVALREVFRPEPPASTPDTTTVGRPAQAESVDAQSDPQQAMPAPGRIQEHQGSTQERQGSDSARFRLPVQAGDTPGRGLETITAADFSPAFSSMGSAVFASADGAVMRAEADAQETDAILRITRVVDDRSHNFHARSSPDGARIAFDSDREGERAVYVADSNGQNVRRVSGDGFAAVPSWSPDGASLAFVKAEPDDPRVWNLWTVNLQSSEIRRLTSHTHGQPWGSSWFPDGRRIAYSLHDRLVVLDIGTSRERVYFSPRKGQLARTPAVSPDGRRVLFQVNRDGAWLLDLQDGSMRKVLSDPSAEDYAWSPDGRRVAYHSRQSGAWGVWVLTSR